ncbi:BolA domain UV induced protein Uvi31 [Coemansia sp. RSA 2336]|nr:BolA domain UV induced protein Uvi31 [Coemansia sp. RSA 2336]
MSSQPTNKEGPIEQLIRERITQALEPTSLKIINESHLHRHHATMKGVTSVETHFRVKIVSEKFDGTRMIKRHREVYRLLADKMKASDGIHALALDTKTPAEIAQAESE